MWEDDNRGTVVKIILAVVSLLLIAGLITAYLFVSKQNEAQDAELLSVYQQHQQEQVTAKEMNYAEVEAAYQADLDSIKTYLPGIVCWGDVLTGGSAGGVSYTDKLKDLIDETICDKYDFKTTLDEKSLSQVMRVNWDDYDVDIPVVNMGVGEENTPTILGRIGVMPYVVSEYVEIPAEPTPVDISFTLTNGREVTPLTQGDGGINPVTINGIKGNLTFDFDFYQIYRIPSYTFTRLEAGSPAIFNAGDVIETAATDQYREYIPIIWIGTYGGYENAQELISQIKKIVDAHSTNGRYIVLGVCTYYDDYTHYTSENAYFSVYYSDNLERYERLESALVQEFGNHFINVRKYLMADGLTDANITPTKDDEHNILKGQVPASFISSANKTELNAKAYELIGKVVYDRMDKLGYFDEIKDELGITALEKQEKAALAAASLTNAQNGKSK